MLGKQHARPGRDRGLEAEFRRDLEFARPRRRAVADRVRQMLGPNAEAGFDDRAAQIHFRAHRRLRQLCQHRMVHCMRADGDQRIGRELGEFRPPHAELIAERRDVDVITGGKIMDDAAQLGFRRARPQPPIKLVVERAFGGDRGAIEGAIAAVDLQANVIVARDHRFERQPPQFADPIRKTRRHIDGERHLGFFEDGICPLQHVAVTVIEGQADETPRKIALDQPTVHLVEADQIEARAAQISHHSCEKARRDLEEPVRLETVEARRPHMVQRQNRTNTGDERLQRQMRAAEIKRLQSAADNRLSQTGHGLFLVERGAVRPFR